MVNEMIPEKDIQLLEYLLAATSSGKIRWEPTAAENQFTAGFKGKYSIVVSRTRTGYWLAMVNDKEQEMLSISNDDDPASRVEALFNAARRVALDVDTAIEDIIKGE